MRIESVRIENFRSFEDATVPFNRYVCLVGPNGAGKSTVLTALNVFFRETENLPTDLSQLTEEDFHCKNTSVPISSPEPALTARPSQSYRQGSRSRPPGPHGLFTLSRIRSSASSNAAGHRCRERATDCDQSCLRNAGRQTRNINGRMQTATLA